MAHARRRDPGVTSERGGPAEAIGALIQRYLRDHGHETRIAQASALDDWARVAGPQISRIAEAVSISADGTLVIAVRTSAWMSELALHEREFLDRLNASADRPPVRRLRWQLRPGPVNP
jgi:predicted nucleic acid-binding Zn ribbon protein